MNMNNIILENNGMFVSKTIMENLHKTDRTQLIII